MKFTPSKYQQRFFDWVTTGTGNAIVKAVAGSGKTTTIVQSLELIPSTERVDFLAFNKKIANELQTRVPKHVTAATFHSKGYKAWNRFHGRVGAPDNDKSRGLISKHFSPMDASSYGTIACKLVSIAKSSGIGAILEDAPRVWEDLASYYDVQLSDNASVRTCQIDAARRLLSLSVEAAMASSLSHIDFDDMLYMPLLKDATFQRVDWIFVDEAQDTNPVQLALLKKMAGPRTRIVAVGDERQAIYGFRGADSRAMSNIRDAFACIELPLTISYRCAQNVVKLAQTIVPHIEASATAPEGEVIYGADSSKQEFKNTDAIICRNNAPIVELAYELIGRGVGCKVLGREIGKALLDVIKKMKAHDVTSLLEKLEVWAAREIAAFISRNQEQRAETIRDRADCIRAIARNLTEDNRSIEAICVSIERMFSDDGEGMLTLCTAHKSKGLEWHRVFIYRPELMPSKWARQPWQQEQEQNLRYVAITRAKHTLVFFGGAAPAVVVSECMKLAQALMPGIPASDEFWND